LIHFFKRLFKNYLEIVVKTSIENYEVLRCYHVWSL